MSVTHHVPSDDVMDVTPTLKVAAESREVLLGGELITLTRTEFDLLTILHRNPFRVLTPDVLLGWLWDAECVPDSHPLEVYVHRLRSKLGESGSNPRFIHTIRGVGYRFEPTPRTDTSVTLHYDRRGILRNISSRTSEVWGWPKEALVDTPFNPGSEDMRESFQRILELIPVLEDAGVCQLALHGEVHGRGRGPLPVRARIRFGRESDRPDVVSVDVFPLTSSDGATQP